MYLADPEPPRDGGTYFAPDPLGPAPGPGLGPRPGAVPVFIGRGPLGPGDPRGPLGGPLAPRAIIMIVNIDRCT